MDRAELVVLAERMRLAEVARLYRALAPAEAKADPAEDGRFVYAVVEDRLIDPDLQLAAGAALAWATRHMRLDPAPAIAWFVPEGDGDRSYVARYGVRDWMTFSDSRSLSGCVRFDDTSTIWLLATLDPERVARTVLHECRHVLQLRVLGPDRFGELIDALESDAAHYARSHEEDVHARR